MIDMILATKFRPERLVIAVDNLFEHSTNPNTRLIIVSDYDDNPTTITAFELINKYPGRITSLINHFSSKGNVAALNSGVNLVTQKYLTYFADDCLLNYKGWDDLAIKLLEENPEYMCLNIRSKQNKNILPFINKEYAYSFVVNTEKFKELGCFDLNYQRYYSDPDFFLKMIYHNELMMTSKDIVFDHIIESDKIFHVNNELSPPERDKHIFFNKWNPKRKDIIENYNKMKGKWNKLV